LGGLECLASGDVGGVLLERMLLALLAGLDAAESEGFSDTGLMRDSVDDLGMPGVRMDPRITRLLSTLEFSAVVTLASTRGLACVLVVGTGFEGIAEGAFDFSQEF
jgi:hypothetical protein